MAWYVSSHTKKVFYCFHWIYSTQNLECSEMTAHFLIKFSTLLSVFEKRAFQKPPKPFQSHLSFDKFQLNTTTNMTRGCVWNIQESLNSRINYKKRVILCNFTFCFWRFLYFSLKTRLLNIKYFWLVHCHFVLIWMEHFATPVTTKNNKYLVLQCNTGKYVFVHTF